MFWLHTFPTLQRNIIPGDACGGWLNLNFYSNFYSIFNSKFIQYICHVLFYCINLSAVFVLTLLLIITSHSVVLLLHVVRLFYLLYTRLLLVFLICMFCALTLCIYIYITDYFNTLLGGFPPCKDLLNVHN